MGQRRGEHPPGGGEVALLEFVAAPGVRVAVQQLADAAEARPLRGVVQTATQLRVATPADDRARGSRRWTHPVVDVDVGAASSSAKRSTTPWSASWPRGLLARAILAQRGNPRARLVADVPHEARPPRRRAAPGATPRAAARVEPVRGLAGDDDVDVGVRQRDRLALPTGPSTTWAGGRSAGRASSGGRVDRDHLVPGGHQLVGQQAGARPEVQDPPRARPRAGTRPRRPGSPGAAPRTRPRRIRKRSAARPELGLGPRVSPAGDVGGRGRLRASSSRSSSWPVAFFAGVFFAPFFLAGLLLGGRRPALAALGEQLGGALEGDRLDGVVLAQRGVVLAVGDVRAEAARLHHHRLAGDRVGAELLERRRGRGPAALLGLGVDRQRLVEGDGEQLVLDVSDRESVPFFR